MDPSVLVLLVHGTFARGAAWTRDCSELCGVVKKACENAGFAPVFKAVEWSGWNVSSHRRRAGATISNTIREQASAHRGTLLFAHSHGGSAAAFAMKEDASLGGRLAGVAFLSTPFVALRMRPGVETSALSVSISLFIAAFATLTWLVWTAMLIGTNAFGIEFGLLAWYGPIVALIAMFFCALVLFQKYAQHFLVSRLQHAVATHETARLGSGNFLFLRSSGDEAAVALSFAQFLATATTFVLGAMSRIFLLAFGFLRSISAAPFGKIVLAVVLPIYSIWIVIMFQGWFFLGWEYLIAGIDWGIVIDLGWQPLTTLHQWILRGLWFPFLALTAMVALFTVVQLLALVINTAALISFGWINLVDALFLDFSIEPLPYGSHVLNHVDWSPRMGASVAAGLNHSVTYTNPQALAIIEGWVVQTLRSVAADQEGGRQENSHLVAV
jgi:hypothetical protein